MRNTSFLLLLLVGGCRTLAMPVIEETRPTINQSDLRLRLSIVAADSMAGRSLSSGGHDRVVSYLAHEATTLGLVPAGDNGTYFQSISIRSVRVSPSSRLVVGDSMLRPEHDFKIFPFGRGDPRPLANAQVIFGGIAGDTTTQITSQQAAKRVVLLDVPATMDAERVYSKILYGPQSRFKDAVAVIIASFDYIPPSERRITASVGLADSAERLASTHPTTILVTRRAAQLLLGRRLDDAQVGMIGKTVNGRLIVEETFQTVRNVIAIIVGSDPALRGEYVALGAHSDHLGIASTPLDHDSVRAFAIERARRGAEGVNAASLIRVNTDSLRKLRAPWADSIFNGADDDGSGTVALLEIAQQFAAKDAQPKRSLLFVWHAAEEMGLIGSAWFVAHPTIPLDSIVAQLNLDMVGRGGASDLSGGGPDYLQVTGATRRSIALEKALDSVNRSLAHPLTLDKSDPAGLFCRSDHWNYARFGIPIAFFTTGMHADYHQLTDEAAYIDYAKLERVTQFVASVAFHLANSAERFEPPNSRPKAAGFCAE